MATECDYCGIKNFPKAHCLVPLLKEDPRAHYLLRLCVPCYTAWCDVRDWREVRREREYQLKLRYIMIARRIAEQYPDAIVILDDL